MQKIKQDLLKIIDNTLSFDINNGIIGKEELADKICEIIEAVKKEGPKFVKNMTEYGAPEIIDEKHKQLP